MLYRVIQNLHTRPLKEVLRGWKDGQCIKLGCYWDNTIIVETKSILWRK